ncbi:hypothetical protein ACHAWX_004896 [Stephanocyclus meneghinianus]
MADFFSRIFAIPSDDESYSAEDTFSHSSGIQAHNPKSIRKPDRSKPSSSKKGSVRPSSKLDGSGGEEGNNAVDESSTSVSLETNEERQPQRSHADKKHALGGHRGRQRRNDEPSVHRSASEPRRQTQNKTRSSSERPNVNNTGASSAAQLHLQSTSRYRNTRSLSKLAEREHHHSPSQHHSTNASPNTETSNPSSSPQENHSSIETHKKNKSWRSKLSAGMKKHLSPTSQQSTASPPTLNSKQVKQSSSKPERERRSQNHATGDKHSYTPQPINVGDSIFISQQFLEESMEISVITLPKELSMKELDDENLMQIVGQKGVLGNNAVQAFLNRRTGEGGNGNNGGSAREARDFEIQPSASMESKGIYERVSSYANRLLDISYSQSLENNSNTCEEDEGVEVKHITKQQEKVESYSSGAPGKYAWACDPTTEGYSPEGIEKQTTTTGSTATDSELKNVILSPPPQPLNAPTDRKLNVQIPLPDDSSGKLVSSTVEDGEKKGRQEPSIMSRPFDEPSAGSGRTISSPTRDPERSNKSVSFCLPPPSSHPPAPPFLGPTLDYYYSMERPSKDPLPSWSTSSLLPPIIELWSSVEDNSDYGVGGTVGGSITLWNQNKENELIGEDAPLLLSEKWINFSKNQTGDRVKKAIVEDPMISPGETSIDYFDNILDCTGEHAAAASETDSLRFSASTAGSNRSAQNNIIPNERSNPSARSGENSMFRHRSQWKSSHGNMTYKPPMFNDGNITPKKEAPALPMVGSESFDDPVMQIRRYHGDDVPSPKKQDGSRPIILHGRIVRPNSLSSNTSNQSKSSSISRSPSTSSHGSSASYTNAKSYAAIAIQASARGMLERQRFMVMLDSVLVIQPFVRRFLCRQRFLLQLKLKRSYFPSNWKRKMTKNV